MVLLEYKLESDPKKENPLRCIRLKNSLIYGLDDSRSKRHCFCVTTQHDSRSYFFQALSPEERDKWIHCIEKTMVESSSKKDLSSTLSLSSNSAALSVFDVDMDRIREESKELPFSQILENFKEPMMVVNPNMVVEAANPSASEFLGIGLSELEGREITTIFDGLGKMTTKTIKVRLIPSNPEQKKGKEVHLSLGHLRNDHLLLRFADVSKSSRFSFTRTKEKPKDRPKSNFS